ncbi:MAG: DUF4446 family protein [Actinomycetota bacterium]|nr:DUF4446 family protein [Actinomycetota bacterium]
MDLTPAQLGTTAVVAAVVAAVGLLVAVGAHLRLGRIRRAYRVLWGDGEADVATLVEEQQRRLTSLHTQLGSVRAELTAVRGDVAQSLRNVAVVRYDAFGDMGGRLSFSCAVVDDAGDGLVISSIHARGESRTYAKGIVGGASAITLTPEEQQALSAARADTRPAGPVLGPPASAAGPGATTTSMSTPKTTAKTTREPR